MLNGEEGSRVPSWEIWRSFSSVWEEGSLHRSSPKPMKFLSIISCTISPIWTLPSPPYRLPSQPSHYEYPFRGMALFLSWHHFPSPDTAFTYVAFQNCSWGWIRLRVAYIVGLPRWCSAKEFVCQCRRCKRWGFNPWVGKIPWSRKWQPNPVFLPGKFHGQRRLTGYSPWGCKKLTVTEHAHTHAQSI